MLIEDGELVFGKRWDEWTKAERHEFCSVMEPEDLRSPLYIDWAMQYTEYLSQETRDYLDELRGNTPRRN